MRQMVPRAKGLAKSLGVILGVVAVGVCDGAASAAGFEGIIWLKETSGGEVTTQTLHLKGAKVRLEESGSDVDGSVVVSDGKKRERFIIDPDEQAYFTLPWSTPTAEDLKQDTRALEVTKTGKSSKVAGHACEMYLERDRVDGSTTEFCIAKGLSNHGLLGLSTSEATLASYFPSWLLEMVRQGAFPLRVVERDKSGKEVSRFEATKVEPTRLDDRLFDPPVGYRHITMEEIGREQSVR